MLHSAKSKVTMVLLLAFALGGIAPAQEKNGKKEPLPPGSSADGAKIYRDYCSGCHGPEAKGKGPAAKVLNTKPTNLTLLAETNKGKFPVNHVTEVLRFGVQMPAHGSSDMPVWGPIFSNGHGANSPKANKRIANIIAYLKTIQAHPKKK